MELLTLKKPPFFILIILVSFASVGAVLFTPALPSISHFFGVTVGQAQLTITFYLIGYALGQLPYGPLANRFGRKKTLYSGIALAIIGSLLCALSSPLHSFKLLCIARFIQAIGACVGLKVSFTIIGDVYDQTQATKMIARLLVAFAIMPGLAVAIGGWITEYLNWESCFYFLALFGVGALFLSSRLPETSRHLDLNALNIKALKKGYVEMFRNKRLVISALLMGCATAVVYVFASKSPFIGIDLIKLTPESFGNYNFIPIGGMLIGAFLSNRLAGRYPVLRLLLIGISISFIFSFAMLIPFLMGKINSFSLFFPMFLIYSTSSLVFANSSAFGLSNAKNKSYGSAILNFINMGTAVIVVLLSGWIYPESALTLPIFFLFLFILMIFLWSVLKKSN